ncbi:hypothetical protein Hanom_Chr04g00349611 [Helianthus anomalus]
MYIFYYRFCTVKLSILIFFKCKERRSNHRDTGRCRLLDRCQPFDSPRCAETWLSRMRGNPTSIRPKAQHHPYSPFTWIKQKIMGRVGVELGSQGTPSFSLATILIFISENFKGF